MKLPGQTPLASISLPQDQASLLRSLWVETAEEAIALAAAVSGNGQLGTSSALRDLSAGTLAAGVPQERLAALRQPRKGGGLGCLLDPQAVDNYLRDGRLRAPRPLPSGVFEDRLPRAVRFFDRMQPVRDQGERGTCVAFASVALREFLLAQPDELSPQFLYWGCKELDGLPDAGTYIHTAMSVFAQYGVCQEAVWPYNPKQTDSEGQGPPPRGARESAQSCRLPSARTVEPGLILHYKHVLAGEHGADGMPVTFGVLVFDSWYKSAETNRTGKITLPLPGEEPAGGHAMCVVGYVDDATVPGGGYFIVRNSWGAQWASDSPEAAGHALMPYDYVERFAMEAFTGASLSSSASEEPQESEEWRDFVRTLVKDARDIDGRLLQCGMRVLSNPRHPEDFREDTSANRQEFLRLNRAWTADARARTWFPLKADWSPDFSRDLARLQAAKQTFDAAIDANLKASVGSAFPDINLPPVASLLPWQPRIRSYEQDADLSSDMVSILLKATGAPADLTPPDDVTEAMLSVHSVRIYRMRSLIADIRVVSAFVSPLALRPGQSPAFARPDAVTVQALRDLVAKRDAGGSGCKPVYTFFSLASAFPWQEGQKGFAAGDHCILLSARAASGEWLTLSPPFFATRVSFRNFLDRMYPLTWQDRVSKVKKVVDRRFADGYEANITVEKIAEETHYRKTAVRDAFLAMQDGAKDAYRVSSLDNGLIAIRQRRPGEPVKLTTASFHRSFLRRHFLLFISAAVGVSGWYARDWLVKKGYMKSDDGWSVFLLVCLVYLTGLIQTQINRRASEEKES
jgi:hypothetical protein